jgi:hypothetical protein
MGLEKPWEKPFDALLKRLVTSWGGEIKGADQKAISEYFIYPTYYGNLKGFRIEIEISEFPSREPYYMEANDNLEYLRIHIGAPANHAIKITHEGLGQKLRKLFHLVDEFQTGDSDFDKKYWLKTGFDSDKELLTNKKFQDYIFKLEPFSFFEISGFEIFWSQEISGASQLDFSEVNKYAGILLDIVAMYAKPEKPAKPPPNKKATPKNKVPAAKKTTTKKITTPKKKTAPKKKAAPQKVRCAGKTAGGKRCQRMVEKPAKYCYLHRKKK